MDDDQLLEALRRALARAEMNRCRYQAALDALTADAPAPPTPPRARG